MKSIVQFLYSALLAALLACSATPPAYAQAPGWSGDLTLASQYVSRRGFQQSWGRPVLQGGIRHDWSNGFYAGSFASQVDRRYLVDAHYEWDIYAGYQGRVGELGYHSTLWYYRYPGARMSASGTLYNYGEWVNSVDWHWLSLSYWLTWTPDYFGDNSRSLGLPGHRHSRGSGYVELELHQDLGRDWRVAAQFGHQHIRHFSDADFNVTGLSLRRGLGPRWSVTGRYSYAWARHGRYSDYTTGVPVNGRVRHRDAVGSQWNISITRHFE